LRNLWRKPGPRSQVLLLTVSSSLTKRPTSRANTPACFSPTFIFLNPRLWSSNSYLSSNGNCMNSCSSAVRGNKCTNSDSSPSCGPGTVLYEGAHEKWSPLIIQFAYFLDWRRSSAAPSFRLSDLRLRCGAFRASNGSLLRTP
jgi:hypothetical protein